MYDLYPEKGLFSLGNLLIKDIMLNKSAIVLWENCMSYLLQ